MTHTDVTTLRGMLDKAKPVIQTPADHHFYALFDMLITALERGPTPAKPTAAPVPSSGASAQATKTRRKRGNA